jgi:arylsulfatase A-like enzyme
MSKKLIAQAQKHNVPYFLFLNLLDVHGPYRPKEPYFSQFLESVNIDQVDLPLVDKFRYHIKSKAKQFELVSRLNKSGFDYLFRMYDSNIRFVDEEIGKFVDNLKQHGQLNNTLILVTADHGEYLGEHGIIGHVIQTMYNPALKIPLIFWFPEKLEPQIHDEFISQVDIFPTILGLLGLENRIPKEIQGINLFSEKRSTDVIAEFWDDNLNRFSRTIISQEQKLIINSNGKIELFNLVEDPQEDNNLVQIFPQKVEEFTLKLNRVLRSFKPFKSKISKKKRKEHLDILKGLGYINQ